MAAIKKHSKARKKTTPKKYGKKSVRAKNGIKTTTLFMNGQSQAVRIPKEYRMPGKKVYIKKSGNCIVLIPVDDPWHTFFEALDEFSDDFMKDGRSQLPPQERDWSIFK